MALGVPGASALCLAHTAGVGVAGRQGTSQSGQALEAQSEQLRLIGLWMKAKSSSCGRCFYPKNVFLLRDAKRVDCRLGFDPRTLLG